MQVRRVQQSSAGFVQASLHIANSLPSRDVKHGPSRSTKESKVERPLSSLVDPGCRPCPFHAVPSLSELSNSASSVAGCFIISRF